MCGGPGRVSVYSKGPLVVLEPPKTSLTAMNGSWEYKGCWTDQVNQVRNLPNQVILEKNNSAENCLSLCAKYKYDAGGLEYGNECYCGDIGELQAGAATQAPEGDCNFLCTGNNTFCGGAARMSYYEWVNPEPLKVFNTPQNKGRYEFLIGGVVVPLVTSVALNGKVVMLEKEGTGAPNSTGAYELDLSQTDNFDAAWREMHLDTDVFCSASIMLPDKWGRILNIGGWSAPSTYGVRLYTPDGSAGVKGVNDWTESPQTQLQNGRWYPTAMMMSNGSVLIVGGEQGSNGPPVPTLELLPKVGGALYMEWLERTDPFNLYPFMTMLPSGDIWAGYYNEAIILDENTFATKRTLPMIPGQINYDAHSGRTYPLEGSMVIMPQEAPYTDPITVMMCGGGVDPIGAGLDNCVSIKPEVIGDEWVIERMPSRRVMGCITPLPDGTYLIVNGAKQGVAGFGLSEDPNMVAVLYDPTKPVGSRMSILGETIVARMYHNEAITLLDGRVLITGSDMQDQRVPPVYPQEYRVGKYYPLHFHSNH